MPGHLDLAAHHLAEARLGGQKDNQVVGFANLLLDLPRPRLADRQALVDEHGVAGLLEPLHDLPRQRLVGLDVPLVAEEGARRASWRACVDSVHEAL